MPPGGSVVAGAGATGCQDTGHRLAG